MLQLSGNVSEVLAKLVPASILNDISCYVFYDNHPRDQKNIDIAVCTKMGEIREYFQRDLHSCVYLENKTVASSIKILRNNKCELFYLVAAGDQLTILHRRDKLEILDRLNNVSKYEICDKDCSGKALLRVHYEQSEALLVPDDNFRNLNLLDFDKTSDATSLVNQESPIIQHLMSKITESKHTAECMEKTYKEFLEIRQSVAFTAYKKIHPNLDNSIFQDDPSKMVTSLKIHLEKSFIKSCNKKIVIAYSICNNNQESLEDVNILLHGTTGLSIEYTTKIFEKITSPPIWKETDSQYLKPNRESALVVVLKVKEMKDNILSKVEFNGVIHLKKSGLECTLPIGDVNLSSLDTMGEQFDVLCTDMDDEIMLAILASTEKTDLLMRHITTQEFLTDSMDESLSFDIFCKYLNMKKLLNSEDIVIFKNSPYHILNGVMIILTSKGNDQLAVTVHSRSSSQVLALIHYLHDAVPHKIVATTPNYKIVTNNHNLTINDEQSIDLSEPVYIYQNYAKSILNRITLIIEYLDKSMIHTNNSRNVEIGNKIEEIDLFAQGESGYKEFKEKMWAEALKGIKIVNDDVEVDSLPLSDDVIMELSNSPIFH